MACFVQVYPVQCIKTHGYHTCDHYHTNYLSLGSYRQKKCTLIHGIHQLAVVPTLLISSLVDWRLSQLISSFFVSILCLIF